VTVILLLIEGISDGCLLVFLLGMLEGVSLGMLEGLSEGTK